MLSQILDVLSAITALCIAPQGSTGPSVGHDALVLAEGLGIASSVVVSADNQAALRYGPCRYLVCLVPMSFPPLTIKATSFCPDSLLRSVFARLSR